MLIHYIKKNELDKSEKYNLRVIEIIDSLNQNDIYLSTKTWFKGI